MFNTIRRNQKSLMFFIAVLTIIAFAWLYNPADTRELGGNVAARVYGHSYSRADLDRLARLYSVALTLGQLDLIQSLGGAGGDENASLNEFVWNLLVLRHEAAVLGIHPTAEQLAERAQRLPAFQTNGVFDSAKFQAFVQEQLAPRGMSALQIEEVLRDTLLLETTRDLIGSPFSVNSAERARALRVFQKVDLVVLPFDTADVRDSVKIIEAQIREYFERNRARFTAPETLSFEYAKFALPAAEKPPEGKERIAALQDLAGRAADFAATKPADFAAAAGEAGAETGSAGPWDRQTAQASPALPPGVAQAAFALPQEETFSDVIQSGNDFFVLKVISRAPERALEFAEAREAAEARAREVEAAKLESQRALEVVAKIRAGLAAGESLDKAVRDAGAAPQVFSGVDLSKPEIPEAFRPLVRVSTLLNPGEISNPIPTQGGFAAIGVTARAMEATLPPGVDLDAALLGERRDFAFALWLGDRRNAADIVFPQRRGR